MKRIVAAILTSTLTQAQILIRDLRRNSGVTISGVVRSVVGNEFILDDGTGQIIVDAGPRWYREINLRQGERVTVVGEYDDYDFAAFSITRSNGELKLKRRSPKSRLNILKKQENWKSSQSEAFWHLIR